VFCDSLGAAESKDGVKVTASLERSITTGVDFRQRRESDGLSRANAHGPEARTHTQNETM